MTGIVVKISVHSIYLYSTISKPKSNMEFSPFLHEEHSSLTE